MKSLVLSLLILGLAGGLVLSGCQKKEEAPETTAPAEGSEMKVPEGGEEAMEEAAKAAEEAAKAAEEAAKAAKEAAEEAAKEVEGSGSQ